MAYLSQDWLDLRRSLAAGLPARPGVTARVQYVVTGTPSGEVRYHESVVDGRLVEVAAGDDPAAEVTLTLGDADARQVAQGEVEVSVAFMQGRAKVVGDMGKLMALMPLLQSEEQRGRSTELSSQTDY